MMNGVFAEYRETHPPAAAVQRDAELWRRLDDLGLVRLTGAEESGGSGAGWHEGRIAQCRSTSRRANPVGRA
jgi:acyl-CoA dehydrogenase